MVRGRPGTCAGVRAAVPNMALSAGPAPWLRCTMGAAPPTRRAVPTIARSAPVRGVFARGPPPAGRLGSYGEETRLAAGRGACAPTRLAVPNIALSAPPARCCAAPPAAAAAISPIVLCPEGFAADCSIAMSAGFGRFGAVLLAPAPPVAKALFILDLFCCAGLGTGRYLPRPLSISSPASGAKPP